MPKLIRLTGNLVDGGAELVDDRFTTVADDEAIPAGDVILSLTRYQAEGEALAGSGRDIGVVLAGDEEVETLVYDLPRIPVIALSFAKYRDGRHYSSARLLRERYGYTGEVRAVGDVLREQAGFMVRCGIEVFAPSDGSTPEQWATAAARYRHVYQRAADSREPIFAERAEGRAE